MIADGARSDAAVQPEWPTSLECRPLASPVDLVIPTIRVDSSGLVR